jgi:transcriptional regulator with XRE-family HTH domain
MEKGQELIRRHEALKSIVLADRTLGEVSRLTNISPSHLSRVLAGKRDISPKFVKTLSQKLGIPIYKLCNYCPTCGQKLEVKK